MLHCNKKGNKMKLIRIDQDVWKVLQKEAVPLEDTPNAVLRRLLRIDQKSSGSNKRRKKRSKRLPRNSGRADQSIFIKPILQVIHDLGGNASAKDVLAKLEKSMKSQLSPIDLEPLKSGQIRWKNTAQWARNELVSDGFLAKETPRGIWKITENGRKYLQSNGKGIL